MPRFSVVIPTLARADTLEHSLHTALAQTVDDFEVVVQNNGNDGATRALVDRLGDPRLKHFHTDEVVSMVENWERALANCTGDLITILGDDDGLLPDACEAAVRAIELSGAEIVSWAPFFYLWPSYWHERRRNHLQAQITFDFVVRMEQSRAWLERFYAFEADYSTLPMLYNSFVARSVVERIRDRYGRYFFGALPDVTSGIINAVETETFAKASRALSVAGASGHSYGNKLSRDEGRISEDELERHFPDLVGRTDPSTGSDLVWLVSLEMEVLEREVLRQRCPIDFERRRLASAMAATINESPSRYADTRRIIEELRSEYELGDDELDIPEPLDEPAAPPEGAQLVHPGEVFFVFDGNRLGMRTIADAVALAAQLVAPTSAAVLEEPAPGATLLSTLVRRARGRA